MWLHALRRGGVLTTAEWLEMRLALTGALRLARGDPSGMACFVASLDGFWRSFRAALICYPMFLILLDYRLTPEQEAVSEMWRIVTAETIGYAIAWAAYPLAALPLARWLGREERFLRFMVAYNWCQVPQTVLFLIVAAIAGGQPHLAALPQMAELIAAITALAYEWYVARLTLALRNSRAVLFVLLDIVLGSMVSRVTESLY